MSNGEGLSGHTDRLELSDRCVDVTRVTCSQTAIDDEDFFEGIRGCLPAVVEHEDRVSCWTMVKEDLNMVRARTKAF